METSTLKASLHLHQNHAYTNKYLFRTVHELFLTTVPRTPKKAAAASVKREAKKKYALAKVLLATRV